MLVLGRDREVANWVGFRLGIFEFGPCAAIGVVRDGHMVAGAVFHDYCHPDVQMSFAAATPRWSTPDAVRGILRYPFLQLNCRRITCLTPLADGQVQRVMAKLGFRHEGTHEEALITGTAMSWGLLRRDAERWIR